MFLYFSYLIGGPRLCSFLPSFVDISFYFCQVLAVGPTGSGKTLCISNKLLRHMPKEYLCHFLTFSARTSANQTQDIIDGKLDKR